MEDSLKLPHEGGDDVVFAEDRVEAFGRILLQLGLGDEIVADAGPCSVGGLMAAGGNGLSELLLPLGKAGLKRSDLVVAGCCRRRCGADPQQLFGAAGEHPVEGVVVVGGDGVVLMVVAAGAGDREPHRGAGHRVDAVVDDVVGDAEEATAEGEEAHRGLGSRIVGGGLVGGQLQDEEAVVGKILVEGLDHPVAIGGGVHPHAVFAGVDIALGVGIAGEVEPAAGLGLAVVG